MALFGNDVKLDGIILAELFVPPRHINGIGITSTYINDDGHLIIEYSDGSSQDAGEVFRQDFIRPAVSEWLDEHPEATTTVQDGSITEDKIDPLFLPRIENSIDPTLSISGAAADAETVGDELEVTVKMVAQTLTDAQKAQAQENIGLENAVQYSEDIEAIDSPADIMFEGGDQTMARNVRFKSEHGNEHDSRIYGGDPESTTAIGAWDSVNGHRIWNYTDGVVEQVLNLGSTLCKVVLDTNADKLVFPQKSVGAASDLKGTRFMPISFSTDVTLASLTFPRYAKGFFMCTGLEDLSTAVVIAVGTDASLYIGYRNGSGVWTNAKKI